MLCHIMYLAMQHAAKGWTSVCQTPSSGGSSGDENLLLESLESLDREIRMRTQENPLSESSGLGFMMLLHVRGGPPIGTVVHNSNNTSHLSIGT